MRRLERGLGEQDAVIGEDRHRVALQVRKAGDQRLAVVLLEFIELRAVDDPGDDLAHIVGLARVGGNHAVELVGGIERLARFPHFEGNILTEVEIRNDLAHKRKGVRVIERVMVGHARDPRMHLGAAQLLGRHHLAGRRLHQRRAGEKDRALAFDDDRFVGHRRHVRAAGGAGAHHAGDLRDRGRRHVGDVVEDAAEVLAVGKHVVLLGQVAAAGIDQIDARQAVLRGDLLRAQVLLHRHRVIGAALDGRVVRDDDALASADPADAADHRGGMHVAAVHPPGGELADLEERRARVEQLADALARQHLAAREVLVARRLVAAPSHNCYFFTQIKNESLHPLSIGTKLGRARIDLAFDRRHPSSRARPITRRWMSLAPS